MGNAGGGNGEKGEGNDELEMVWAFIVAIFAATVAYRVWRLLSRGSSGSSSIPMEKKLPQEAQALWSPPPKGCFKLNTDFSGPSEVSGPSGIGWLIRDHRGDMVDCGSEQVDLHSDSTDDNSGGVAVHEGEALALLKGLEKARDYLRNLVNCGAEQVDIPWNSTDDNCYKVVAETDHLPNVNCINSKKDNKRNDYITQIREARENWFHSEARHKLFNGCQVTHIDRKANQCAHHLAGIGIRHGSRSYKQLRDANKCTDHPGKCGPTCSYQDRQRLKMLLEQDKGLL